ncbi:hypothetical protein IQ254_06300 [Nodosilinea sp. LEGE 07088]|nr:hypothetical protein [Nodosilinea sp. LEGE 07088]
MQFVVCRNNADYEASLEIGKIYRSIRDDDAMANGLMRIVDESGDDDAFAASRFYPIDLPKPIEDVLLAV